MRLFLIVIFGFISFLSFSKGKKEVPFQNDGYIYVEALLNDTIRGRFVFDTGASNLVLDSTFVSKHSSIIQNKLDTARMGGAGNSQAQQVLVINNPIKISLSSNNHTFSFAPILELTKLNGENIAGIIGNKFIGEKLLFINNENSTLKIDTTIDKGNYPISIPFEKEKNRIFVKTEIQLKNGKTIVPKLMIDLGSLDAITLNTPFYEIHKTEIENPYFYSMLHDGVSGKSDGGEFRATKLIFAKNEFLLPIISFSIDTLGAFSNTYYDGLLGNEIMKKFNYAIDYQNNILYLKRNKNFSNPFVSTLSGFYLEKKENIGIVKSLYYQSEAYKKGLRLNDVVTKLNNKAIADLSQKEIDTIISNKNNKLLISTELQDIQITLKELIK